MKAFKYLPATLSLARRAGKNIYTKLFFIIVVFSFSFFAVSFVKAAEQCKCGVKIIASQSSWKLGVGLSKDKYHYIAGKALFEYTCKMIGESPSNFFRLPQGLVIDRQDCIKNYDKLAVGGCNIDIEFNEQGAIAFNYNTTVDYKLLTGKLFDVLNLPQFKKNDEKKIECGPWGSVLYNVLGNDIQSAFFARELGLPKTITEENCEDPKMNKIIRIDDKSSRVEESGKTWYVISSDPENILEQYLTFQLKCKTEQKPETSSQEDQEAQNLIEYNALKESVEGLRQLSLTGKNSTEKVQKLIGKIIKYLLGFTGSLALAMFVGGGLMWMTARGNAERTAKALKMITWASLGVVVILASFVIVKFIFDLFK